GDVAEEEAPAGGGRPVAAYGAGAFGASTPFSASVETAFVFRSTTRMRWALVSATYSLPAAYERPPGSLKRRVASQPSGSPPRKVLQVRVTGSRTLILLL